MSDPQPNRTQGEIDTILIVFLCTSIISVLSQLFIVIFYLIYTNLRRPNNFSYRLIFFLAITDIIVWGMRIESNIEKIATNDTAFEYSPKLCSFLGFLWNFFLLLNIMITLVISICLMLEVFFHVNSQKYEKYFYFFIITYSLCFSVIPWAKNVYGKADQIKCWIPAEESDYRILAFYSHLWSVFILNSLNVSIILWKLRSFQNVHRTLIKKFVWFPIIMLIFWIEPSYRRLFNSDDGDYNLELWQYILMPTQGTANAIVYGLVNQTVRAKLWNFFTCRWRTPEERKNTLDESTEVEQIRGKLNISKQQSNLIFIFRTSSFN